MLRKRILALLGGLGAVACTAALAAALIPAPAPAPANPEPDKAVIRGGISVAVTVEVLAEGTVPADSEGYTVRLSAEDNAPMPAEDPVYDLHMPGPGTAAFPAVTFSTLGVYHYHLALLPGTDTGAAYDPVQYELSVSVLRDENTDEWFTMLSIRNTDTQEKTDIPLFIIVYPESEETPTPTVMPDVVSDPFDLLMLSVSG